MTHYMKQLSYEKDNSNSQYDTTLNSQRQDGVKRNNKTPVENTTNITRL